MSKPVPLTTAPRIAKALEMLGNAPVVGFDTESIGPNLRNAKNFINVHRATMMGFSFAFDDGTAFYAPIHHRDSSSQKNMHYATIRKFIAGIFEVPEIWSHNAKHDYKTLCLEGYTPDTSNWLDSNVACWLQRGINRDNGLKERVKVDLGRERDAFNTSFWNTTPAEAAPYACGDAVDTLELGTLYRGLMSAKERAWFHMYESPVVFPVGDMEMTGIAVDWDKLDDLDKVCREVQGRVKLKFDGLVRGLVEIGSSDSLQQFFDRGHWPKGKRGKKGYSTKAEILEGFEDDHYNCTGVGREAARLILEYRKVSKILSTYTYPLVEMAQQYPDNRLHTSLNPRGAGTGRFTSQAPNSQNFPKRGELADAIRKAFRTSEDKILLGADLSQIEYRLLSHFCGGEMLQSYLDGEDLHNRTAEIMNVPRDDAKTVNFCRIYGGSDQKVFSIIGRQDGAALGRLDGFLAANVDFDRGVEQCLRDRQPVPYVKTISGRKKVLYEPGSEARVFRQAKNAVVQGSAADVMKVGIVNAKKNFGDQWLKVIHPVTTVHDELILEVHREAYQAGKDWIQDTLERSMTTMPESWGLTVPLVAEAKYGSTWKDLK